MEDFEFAVELDLRLSCRSTAGNDSSVLTNTHSAANEQQDGKKECAAMDPGADLVHVTTFVFSP